MLSHTYTKQVITLFGSDLSILYDSHLNPKGHCSIGLQKKDQQQKVSTQLILCVLSSLTRVNIIFSLRLFFPKGQILDSSKLKQFTGDNFKFDENDKKFSKRVENTVGKREMLVTSNLSFSHSVFARLVLQTRKSQGLFGKGLNN